MRKKILVILLGFALSFSIVGCGETKVLNVNVYNSNELGCDTLGKQSFIEIGNGLYYDAATRIVYMFNYTYNGNSVYTAYYAPNGFPYRYNPETNTFEEINFANK